MITFPDEISSVATDLAWLDSPPFFFGASVLETYIDRRDMLDDQQRPTDDVDVIVRLGKGARVQVVVAATERELRERGWKDDMRPGRRNKHAFMSPSGVAVDIVMDRLYPVDDWPLRASTLPETYAIRPGQSVLLPSPALFLACKIAASRNLKRWEVAGIYCHDLEDVSVLLAGCSRLLLSAQESPADVREYLATWAAELLTAETEYGEAALSLVMDDAPKAADQDEIRALLVTIGALA